MLKVISLMKRREDLSLDEFRRWAMEEHVELGKKLPGLRQYHMSVAVEDDPDAPYDAVSELWFDDHESFATAFATEEGKAAGADAAAHASSRSRLMTTELKAI